MKKIWSLFLFSCLTISAVFAQSSVWKVSHDGNTLYLGGSIHALRKQDFPMPREFDTAFELADMLVLETDVEKISDPQMVSYMMANMFLPEGENLRSVLCRDAYKRLLKKCKNLGVPFSEVSTWKPSIVVNVLSTLIGQEEGLVQQGVDLYYLSMAKQQGMSIEYLEPVKLQIDLLFTLGEGYEDAYVLYSLKDFNEAESSLSSLISEWKHGGSTEVEKSLQEMKTEVPLYYAALITNRNNAWIPLIEKYLEDETVEFVVAGLAHMYGPEGLLEQLKNRGYSIEQLKE